MRWIFMVMFVFILFNQLILRATADCGQNGDEVSITEL